MITAMPNQINHRAEIQEETEVHSPEGWDVRNYDVVNSTNLVAASFPAWTVVRANQQNHGRGRFQRKWISDAGGLWFSAVIPINSDSATAGTLPLAAGLAVCDSFCQLGVPQFRMRWPNDVLVQDRKLAGLLLDQFTPGLCVVGIGINVHNRPEALDASLEFRITRLADVVPNPPELPNLMGLVLRNIRRVQLDLESSGFDSLLPRVNQLWGAPRRVELDLDGELHRGVFTGVDAQGRLILAKDTGAISAYAPHQVRHLQEI